MSLTSKQIDELRAYAADRKGELAKLINDAADTIEELSAKLHAYKNPVDMFPDLTDEEKRASREYAQGYSDALKDTSRRWMPCSERLPEEGQCVLVCDKGSILIDTFIGQGNPYNWRWYVRDYEAWMPLPEPYQGEGE